MAEVTLQREGGPTRVVERNRQFLNELVLNSNDISEPGFVSESFHYIYFLNTFPFIKERKEEAGRVLCHGQVVNLLMFSLRYCPLIQGKFTFLTVLPSS